MKILFLQLSDLHISKKSDIDEFNLYKIVDALNIFSAIDICFIVVSGDITSRGKSDEFIVASEMIDILTKKIKEKRIGGTEINVLIVPGNHDLDLTNNERTFDNIVDALKAKNTKCLINNDLKSLDNFYIYANHYNCFCDDKMVSQQQIEVKGVKINFTLINTSIFSLQGSSNQDKGIHYLNEENMANLIPKIKGDLNIAVMHHGIEWHVDSVKEEFRQILCNNFSIVFEGHEHDGHGENRKINCGNSILHLQGNSLSGDKIRQKGFVAATYNFSDKSIEAYSFKWNNDYYKPIKISNESLIDKTFRQFKNSKDFLEQLYYDDNMRKIDQYFVFPSLNNNTTNNKNEIETNIIDDIDSFIKVIRSNDRTIISGESKSGKSTLAKVIYQYFIDDKSDIVPILLFSEELQNKKISRVIENAFHDQYSDNENMYDKFLQLEKDKRIVIIDDAGTITKKFLDNLLENYDNLFTNIILLSEEKLDLNIEKQVVDALLNKKVAKISIRPFLYDKRKELISKIYTPEMDDNKNSINTLNDMISLQARYFRLDPEFIINFVTQYNDRYKFDFSSESNIFNIVYENSIKDRIIKNTHALNVDALFRAFCEIAFYKQFERKTWITIREASDIIDAYNKEFRQNVDIRVFLEVGEKSKIIICKESRIRFKNNNLLAYFVAHSLNMKYHHEEDIDEKIKYLLNNLCFSINSDIILFLSFITNNPKIINLVIHSAKTHFENMEELNFDKNNIPFLCQSDFCVKNTVPDNNEKKEREKQLIKYEEEIKASELIELIDENDYNEDDIKIFENQVIKSIKYLEILSKILPAFSHNMKAKQQDILVQSIYRFTNCFLYFWLKQISDGYDELVLEIYTKISELRREKNISEMHINSVQKMIEQISISLIINLYQLVANTATTSKTIIALNEFDFASNSNFSIMNLMMVEKTAKIKEFHHKAENLYDNSKINLVKSMVKYTVRNFFLHHDVKLVGETQSLLDKFFGDDKLSNRDKAKIKSEMIKNKMKGK